MIGKCTCCEELRKQRDYLQGLVDRLIKKVAPVVEDSVVDDMTSIPAPPAEADKQLVYGQG